MGKPSVFISYSHDSEEHKDRVLSFADQLCDDGIDCWLDHYIDAPPEGWTQWMNNCINDADFVLMICTEKYYNRVMGKENIGIGLGGKFEGKLIITKIYHDDCRNTKYIPVLLENAQQKFIPDILQDFNYYVINTEEGYEDLYRRITNQPKVTKPVVKDIKTLESKSRTKSFILASKQAPKIEISKLPVTGAELFGREKELEILDKAWEDPQTRALSFVAWGGVGKSALINYWLNKMAAENYKGAERVYGWSFYSQGTKEKGQASADGFINDAIKWFGYEGEIPKSQFERARLLAEIISKQKTLLILDGLEPLQYPPGQMHGFLKDKTMPGLLKNITRSINGLCIITSRCRVEDLRTTEGTLSRTHELERLSDKAGMAVLKSYDLKGMDDEFIKTTQEFKGHALALHLAGSYLKTFHNGDIKQRFEIPQLTLDEKNGGHARRAMEAYENWFAEINKAELDVLHLLGLFDRPAAKEATEVLTAEPAIPGLTDRLQKLSNHEWQATLSHLRQLRLIAEKDEHDPDTLDCHPLIREHFSDKLEKNYPAAWKEAHVRLYEYYKNLPEKELPDTLEEMEPLFAAVKHGCLAGKYQETLADVYWEKINRKNQNYVTAKLGAIGSDLCCLSSFFETLWDKPASSLEAREKDLVLNWAGFSLRALGRLSEAAELVKVSFENAGKLRDWKNAALAASTLSELYLTLGDVASAENYGKQSVTFANRSKDDFQMESKRTTHADVLHQSGRINDAEKLFIEAENIQKKRLPEYPYLFSLWGYRFCDLLLSMEKYEEALKRAQYAIKINTTTPLADLGYNSLSIGKALMYQAIADDSADYIAVEKYLNQAVDGLRIAGYQDDFPLGLLARAALYKYLHDFSKSWINLDEAREIAEYGQMRLHLTDYHLEAGRVILAQLAHGNADNQFTIIDNGIEIIITEQEMKKLFNQHIRVAGKLIKETGYHRRDAELEELKKKMF